MPVCWLVFLRGTSETQRQFYPVESDIWFIRYCLKVRVIRSSNSFLFSIRLRIVECMSIYL
jgi:hypothetical protein